jgi:DNA invertase Pin-like site-specific DNA recombinase
MIKDAEEKKFDVILTTSFTRLARNRKLLNTLSGIQIITLEERKTDAK